MSHINDNHSTSNVIQLNVYKDSETVSNLTSTDTKSTKNYNPYSNTRSVHIKIHNKLHTRGTENHWQIDEISEN